MNQDDVLDLLQAITAGYKAAAFLQEHECARADALEARLNRLIERVNCAFACLDGRWMAAGPNEPNDQATTALDILRAALRDARATEGSPP